MSDSYSDPQQNQEHYENRRDQGRPGFRGGRGPGNRDGGGFRIRLSDNEMRSARAIQDAFNLRSPVAVLGFALRTLGDMLEQGQLEDLITEHRSQVNRRINRTNNDDNPNDRQRSNSSQNAKVNPFARPSKPETTSVQNDIDPQDEEELKESVNQEENDDSSETSNEEQLKVKSENDENPSS